MFSIVIIPGNDCCKERLKGFTVHGEPDYVEIYVDGSPTYQYMGYTINVSIPERFRNTKFSNITIAVPAKDEISFLTLCEVEVNLGKWITCRAKWTDNIAHIVNGYHFTHKCRIYTYSKQSSTPANVVDNFAVGKTGDIHVV